MSIANDGEANIDFPGEHFVGLIDARLEALGRLGLSTPALQDLREIFVDDAEDASLEAHSLALSGLSLLVQARNAAGATEAPFGGVVIEEAAQKIIPLHRVTKVAPPEVSVESTVQALEVPEAESTTPAATDKAKQFLSALLETEELVVDLTQEQAEAFTEILFSKYVAARKIRIDTAMLERQKRELLLLMEGRTLRAIKEEVGAPSTVAVSLFRIQFRTKLAKAYGVDRLRSMFTAFRAGEENVDEPMYQPVKQTGLSDVITVPSVANFGAEAAHVTTLETQSAAPERDPYEEWLESIKSLVEPYWKPQDVKGLLELLDDKSGEDVDSARYHLRALMAAHTPLRPSGGTGAANMKWTTLNLLSGYNLQQSEKPLPPRYIIPRLRVTYEKHGVSFTTVLQSTLSEYIQLAASDYATGWYPGQVAETPQRVAIPETFATPVTKEVITEAIDEAAQLRQAVTRSVARLIGRTGGFNVPQLELLVKHLTGEATDVDERQLLLLTRPLSEKTNEIIAQSRHGQSRGKKEAKHTPGPQEIVQLSKLYGSLTARGSIAPLTIDQIVAQTRQGGGKITRSELIESVRHTLHTLAGH